jgi:hypothetical protein
LLSGTLIIRNCMEAREVVARWHMACVQHPDQWDQKSLEGIYPYDRYLDSRWCYIDGIEVKQPGVVQCNRADAIVIHHQASRTRRKQ